jgi:hypothetical protein
MAGRARLAPCAVTVIRPPDKALAQAMPGGESSRTTTWVLEAVAVL